MDDTFYKRAALKGWDVIMHRDARPEEAIKLLSSDGSLHSDESVISRITSTPKSRVFLAAFHCSGRNSRVYLKQFPLYLSLRYLIYLVCTGRAKRAFRASLMLEDCGFNAPKPLVLMEKKYGLFCTNSILLTKEVPDSMQLGEKLQQLSRDRSRNAIRQKRRLIRQFGKVVGEMHQKGILHGDLRLRNVLVREEEEGFSFWFIDNERTKRFSRLRPGHVRKNLVQLNMKLEASNTDRLRFVKAYADQRGLTNEEVKAIVLMVQKRIGLRRYKKALSGPLKYGIKKIGSFKS